MTAALLCVLGLLDAAFSGFRGAAGLDARINKRGYDAEATAWGAVAGVLALGLIGLWVGETLGVAEHPVQRFAAYDAAGERMLWVYLPYAAVVLAALVGYVSLPFEAANLMTLLILGPFTLLRPVVIAAGVLAGAVGTDDGAVVLGCVIAGALMLAIGPTLSALHRAG